MAGKPKANKTRAERNPTTTAVPARVRMFQASLRPVPLCGEVIVTKHGRLEITGRLGQRHADLYEAILKYAVPYIDPATDQVLPNVVVVEPAQLRRVLSGQYSYAQIRQLAVELRDAKVEIWTEKFEAVGSIFAEVRRETVGTVTGGKLTGVLAGQEKSCWRIYLGAALQDLLNCDVRRYYDPALISRLSSGVSQAVARWLLTHQRDRQPNGGWHIDTVIRAVCGDQDGVALRKRRAELRRDAEGLATLGIVLAEARLSLAVVGGASDDA